MFHTITMINFKRPLRERLASRKYVGPYRWTPQDGSKRKGFGFYQGGDGLFMDEHGSICDLRLEEANDHLRDYGYGSLSRISGYFCDDEGDGETLKPIIARLPKGRGFLAGWTMGPAMCASMSTTIHDDIEDAARAAHAEAETAAEREREYQAEQQAKDEEE